MPILVTAIPADATAATTVPVASGTPYRNAVAADRPIYWWHLDETSGTSFAAAVGGTSLTIGGTVTLGQAHLEGAVGAGASARFSNAAISYGEAPSSATFAPANLSVEVLIQGTGAVSGNARLVENGPDTSWFLIWNTTTTLCFGVPGHAQANYTFSGDAQRHHVVGTYDSTTGTAIVYMDGVEAARAVGTAGAPPTTASPLRVGQKPTGTFAGDGFNGLIDEVAIYATALSATQVSTHSLAAGLLRASVTAVAAAASADAATPYVAVPRANVAAKPCIATADQLTPAALSRNGTGSTATYEVGQYDAGFFYGGTIVARYGAASYGYDTFTDPGRGTQQAATTAAVASATADAAPSVIEGRVSGPAGAATVTAVPGIASADAPLAVVTSRVTIRAVPATGVADAAPSSVAMKASVSAAVGIATADVAPAQAGAGTLGAVAAAPAAATADGAAPTIRGRASLVTVPADAAASSAPSTVVGLQRIAAVVSAAPGDAVAGADAPVPGGKAQVLAAALVAAADAAEAVLLVAANVRATVPIANATVAASVAAGKAFIRVVAAAALADAHKPKAGTPRDITLFVSLLEQRYNAESLPGRWASDLLPERWTTSV